MGVLVVLWLIFGIFIASARFSPWLEKVPQAMWCSQKKKKVLINLTGFIFQISNCKRHGCFVELTCRFGSLTVKIDLKSSLFFPPDFSVWSYFLTDHMSLLFKVDFSAYPCLVFKNRVIIRPHATEEIKKCSSYHLIPGSSMYIQCCFLAILSRRRDRGRRKPWPAWGLSPLPLLGTPWSRWLSVSGSLSQVVF